MNALVSLLNSQQQFWNHRIFIDSPLDIEIDQFKENVIEHLPHNMKEQGFDSKKLNMDKWLIMKGCTKKPCMLAGCYAQHILNMALQDIKSVWGDFNNKEEFIKTNPQCPYIRK